MMLWSYVKDMEIWRNISPFYTQLTASE